MRRIFKSYISLLVHLIICCVNLSLADIIILDNGHRLVGCIINERGDKVQMETFSGIVTIDNNRIQQKIYSSPQTNEIIRAEFLLNEEKWSGSFARYLNVLEDKLTSAGEVARSIHTQGEKIISALPRMKQPEQSQLLQLLDKLLQLNLTDEEFTFFSARVFFELGMRERAFSLLAQLPGSFYEANPQSYEFFKLLLQRLIDDLVKGGEFSRALELIETVNYLNKSLGQSYEILLYLRWGASLREQGNYAGALQIYGEKLLPLAPAIAPNRIGFLFNELISATQKKHNFEEVLSLLNEYGKRWLPPTEYEYRLAELLNSYGTWLMNNERYAEARQIFARLNHLRESPTSKRLEALCDYKTRASLVASDDYAGRYELGKFCVEHNLLDEAIAEFNRAAQSEVFAENSTLQIRLIKERQEMELFKQAMQLYESANFVKALDVLDELQQKFPSGSLSSEANKLSRLIQDALKNELWRRPYQAEVYYQQAERFYFMNDFNSALDKINQITELYSETPAASKASKLKEQIVQISRLARLEGKPIDIDSKKLNLPPLPAEEKKQLEQEIKSILNDFEK